MLDYHVHLWPHPEHPDPSEQRLERLTDYADLARARGVEEIALTEHLFRFGAFRPLLDEVCVSDPNPVQSGFLSTYFDDHGVADLDTYVDAVLEAKAAGLPVLLGLEVDFFPGRMAEVGRMLAGYPFDVLLGSVHWLGAWGFDMLEGEALLEWDRRDVADVWRAYTDAIAELAASGACDVLAHPDLAKIAGRRPDPVFLDECHDRMAEAAAANGLAAEINSAGWRKPHGEIYPAPSLLRRFFLRGVPITTASDTHGEANLAERGADVAAVARAAGYGSLRAFSQRHGRDVPISMDAVGT